MAQVGICQELNDFLPSTFLPIFSHVLQVKRKEKKQAGAGVVPSSGLVNSLVKIEFLTIDVV